MGASDTANPLDVLRLILGIEGASADATSQFAKVGGKYHSHPATAIAGSGTAIPMWLSDRGYITPALKPTQLYAQTTAAAGTTTGTWFSGVAPFDRMQLFVDVTAISGDTATLNIYADTQLDATGTTNVAHALIAVAGGTSQVVIVLARPTAAGTVDVEGDAGAGTVRAIHWADNLRIRSIISGDTASISHRVWILGIG